MEHCDKCGQKIRQSFKVPLSKNNIRVLWTIYQVIRSEKDKHYIQTKEVYGRVKGGSATAELTRLKYLGAITKFFTAADRDKLSKRSGKWTLTDKGKAFIEHKGTLPNYVVILNEDTIESGSGIFVDDESLKWHTEDAIWAIMREHWTK